MADRTTANIVELQSSILKRLADLGFVQSPARENLSRQLASLAVLGNRFAQTTLPLFLTIDSQHEDAISQLATSMKCDLEELGDAVADVDVDLRLLMEFLNQ